jgi:hypothetical protein
MTKGRVVMIQGRGLGIEKAQVPSLRSCSATSLAGSTALSFVISTEAQRSGEISGCILFLGNVVRTVA